MPLPNSPGIDPRTRDVLNSLQKQDEKPSLGITAEATAKVSRRAPGNICDPRLHIIYGDQKLYIFNDGQCDLTLSEFWYGEDPKPGMDAGTRLIPVGTYYYLFSAELEKRLSDLVRGEDGKLIPCFVMVNTPNKDRFTLKCELFAKRASGVFSINAQNVEVVRGWPQDPEFGTKVSSARTPTQRPYDLSGIRGSLFLELLSKKQAAARDMVRIGCTAWSEESCVAAGKFLLLFSKAGWTIDSDRVFRLEPQIPIDGIAMISHTEHAEDAPKLPPHLGRWQKMDDSQVTIFYAFNEMGIPVQASTDESLPKGTLGIYFGPEPK